MQRDATPTARAVLAACAAGLMLSACTPDRVYRMPSFPFAQKFSGAAQGAPVLLQNDHWWQRLRDPDLDRLIERALSGSIDLAVARERLTEAQATRFTVEGGGNLGPVSGNLSLEGGASGSEHGGGPFGGQNNSLSLQWLLDPYGGRRARVAGAEARVETARAEVDAAQLALLRQICLSYVELRYYQALLARRTADLKLRRDALEVAQKLLANGNATRLDSVRTEARIAATEAALPSIRAQIKVQQHMLAVLAGQAPGSLDLGGLARGGAQPRPGLPANVGIPADLLRNRPDIRIAERDYYAALTDFDSAEADRWPRLSLSGTLSRSSGDVGAAYWFGPTLQIPELFSTQPKYRARAAASRARQAHLGWRSTVLGAISDVEDQLAVYGSASEAVGAQERSVRLYREALGLTDQMIALDTATISDRLDAMEDLSDSETALVSQLRDMGRAFVELNVALGSGSGAAPAQIAQP